jgi:hypothetical protein
LRCLCSDQTITVKSDIVACRAKIHGLRIQNDALSIDDKLREPISQEIESIQREFTEMTKQLVMQNQLRNEKSDKSYEFTNKSKGM